MERSRLLSEISEWLTGIRCSHPLRVAIDGIDTAGKTILADDLATEIGKGTTHLPLRASVDSFHNPRAIRYQRGVDSPEGYYVDSFDYGAMIERLLKPLGPGGDRRVETAVFDLQKDAPLYKTPQAIPDNTILLCDGIFLHRPTLRPYWDITLYLEIHFEVALERALMRDTALLGSADAVRMRYLQRYIPGQQIYLAQCRPQQFANMVIDHNDPANPTIVSWRAQQEC
ncbi:MAG: hypothetical protein KC413_18295 [Anaerolineales bacterium]|nr:hypothetical protein [Anaerolineales bacterium]MCA9977719.1 hypothetical protein [Anaerolineales bacterium]